MATFAQIKALHESSPSFTTPLPVDLLPVVALITLVGAFILTFIFTTLHKSSIPLAEVFTAIGASSLAGIGLVALFCSVGVHV